MEIKYAIAVAPVLTLLAACQSQNTYIPYELWRQLRYYVRQSGYLSQRLRDG